MGFWLTLEEAKACLDACDGPDDMPLENTPEGYARVEIHEHPLGWTNRSKRVFEREWTGKWDEDTGEDVWQVVQPK